MVFQLRDALKVGNIQLSTHFFSLKLGVNEAIKVIRSELTNFAIVVEPPKTTFGKVRKTYTGKIQGSCGNSNCSVTQLLTDTPCVQANKTTSRSPSSWPLLGCAVFTSARCN